MINLAELEAKARAARERGFPSPVMLHHEEVTTLIAAMRVYVNTLTGYAVADNDPKNEAITTGAKLALARADKILGGRS